MHIRTQETVAECTGPAQARASWSLALRGMWIGALTPNQEELIIFNKYSLAKGNSVFQWYLTVYINRITVQAK